MLRLDVQSLPLKGPPPDRATSFFEQTEVPTFQLRVAPGRLATLQHNPREYVPAEVEIGGVTLTNVGMHLKGFGSFRPLQQKPALVLKFNEFVPGRRWHGLHKLMLNNSVQDPSYLGEYLASRMFLDAGLATPRTTHARVVLNGRELGLYVVAEAVNADFLRRWFGSAEGNLYEGAIQDIDGGLEQDNGVDHSRADLEQFTQALRSRDPSQLAAWLDPDRTRAVLAVELMAGNWDGYVLHQNNYRLYHHPRTGHMELIPHGLDNSIHETRLSVLPPRRNLLTRALLGSEPGRQSYREIARELAGQIYDLAVWTNRIREVSTKLARAADSPEAAAVFQRREQDLYQRVTERSRFLRQQLSGAPVEFTALDPVGFLSPQGWQPETDWVFSNLTPTQVDGRTLFHIRSGPGGCNASWRLELHLPPGRYRFEGNVRVEGVSARGSLTGSGAGLRILGNQRGGGLEGTQDWTPLQHAFRVEADQGPVTLLCELRAVRGQAWFDASSLRLHRN